MPRFRLTVRRTMVAVAVIAVVLWGVRMRSSPAITRFRLRKTRHSRAFHVGWQQPQRPLLS